MSDRKYNMTIVRSEPNPAYDPESNRRGMGYGDSQPFIETRELFASITEDELNTIKQALIKVWS